MTGVPPEVAEPAVLEESESEPEPEPIHFYSKGFNPKYYPFSNFAPYSVKIDGETWKTTEHYFQAVKFKNTAPNHYRAVMRAPTPNAAKQLGRSRRYRIDPNWDQVRENFMFRALRAKFEQHADLKQLLLETGTAYLAEHTENDKYWGDGGDGSGENRLGHLLMRLRQDFISSEKHVEG